MESEEQGRWFEDHRTGTEAECRNAELRGIGKPVVFLLDPRGTVGRQIARCELLESDIETLVADGQERGVNPAVLAMHSMKVAITILTNIRPNSLQTIILRQPVDL